MILWGQPLFSALLAGAYLALTTLLWLSLVWSVPRWGRAFLVPLPAEPPPERGPRVSVCIPARDEAHNVGLAVRAALASRWPDLEVVVVDDRSQDGTADRAREAGSGDPRLHVVSGSDPPAGWSGKAWACARGAAEAKGDLLLFVDADVRLHPDALHALAAHLSHRGLDLLSAFGTWSLVSFWERAVVPAVGWLIRGAVDLRRVNDPGCPDAFANGQFILVRREAYEAIGGHEVVAGQILDDVRLAQAMKRRGRAAGLVVAPWAFEVRLYRSLREIIAGYSKNLYEGMGRRPLVGLGAVLFIFVGTLFPFLALALALAARLWLGWSFPAWHWAAGLSFVCALQFVFRWRIDRRDGRSGADSWTHPLANAVLVWILLRSVFGVEARWKGRRFVDGRAA